jgi:hypothetical protein
MKTTMSRRIAFGTVLALVCFMAAGVSTQNHVKTIGVILEPPRQHIPDLHLVERLVDRLARFNGLSVVVIDEDSIQEATLGPRYDLSRILDRGDETGCRYVIYLQIDDRRIDLRKQVSIPFVLSHYVVEGRLEGMYTLVDLRRRRAAMTMHLDASITGPHKWQVIDDYPQDPDLHMPAPDKIRFLRRLEERAAQDIFEAVLPQLKGR